MILDAKFLSDTHIDNTLRNVAAWEEDDEDPSQIDHRREFIYRTIPKLVFVISVISLIFLTFCMLQAPWMLPYYFTISVSFLIWIRIIVYWRKKFMFFLLDFCYFAVMLLLMFLWVLPHNAMLFSVVFALSNGPLLWAVIVYRNSLVFHNVDKVTSAFIHLVPAMLTFSIRWRTAETSKYWYRSIAPEQEDIEFYSLVAIPLGAFIAHSLIYALLVHVVLQPSDEHITSYKYLTENESSTFHRLALCVGERYRLFIFIAANWLFCFMTLCASLLLYQFHLVHYVALCLAFFISIYNGGSYYIDIFGKGRRRKS